MYPTGDINNGMYLEFGQGDSLTLKIFAECFTIPVGEGKCSGNKKQVMFTLVI